MAKPTGAIGIAEINGYWLQDDDVHEFIYYGHRIAQAIEYWATEFDMTRLQARYKACCTVAAGNTIYLSWGGGALETVTGPVTRQWSAAWSTTYNQPVVENMGSPDPHDEDPSDIETLRSRVGVLEVWAADRQAGVVHSILIELFHNDVYADNDAEIIDRTDVGADLIYLPNMPVSSWQMQRILCDTYNKLGYQSRLVLCLPLFKKEYAS